MLDKTVAGTILFRMFHKQYLPKKQWNNSHEKWMNI